jgi:hypothetical protein
MNPFEYNEELTEAEIKHFYNMLSNWKKFNGFINDMTEKALKKAFVVEWHNRCRLTILLRLKGRINKVCNRREDLLLKKQHGDPDRKSLKSLHFFEHQK